MNETFYALVENGVVTNVMVLYPPSAAEFEGAVPCGDLPVAVGDTWDGEHFYRGGPTKAITAVKLFAIKIIFGKDWCIMMAMFFAQRVILGKTTFANVPKALKAGVAEVLIDSGLPELVPTEYGGTADGE